MDVNEWMSYGVQIWVDVGRCTQKTVSPKYMYILVHMHQKKKIALADIKLTQQKNLKCKRAFCALRILLIRAEDQTDHVNSCQSSRSN
jgi:hypothetical protein